MLAYDDADRDGHLNLNEFYAAFSKLYSKPRLRARVERPVRLRRESGSGGLAIPASEGVSRRRAESPTRQSSFAVAVGESVLFL